MLGSKIRTANRKAMKRFYGMNNLDSLRQIEKQGDTERFFGMLRKTTKVCSRPWCCGNQRHNKWSSKTLRLTMRERKAPEVYEWDGFEMDDNNDPMYWASCPLCEYEFLVNSVKDLEKCPDCGLTIIRFMFDDERIEL